MYAGPVGWFGGGESEFAVGIRSALVEKVRQLNSFVCYTFIKMKFLAEFFYISCILD